MESDSKFQSIHENMNELICRFEYTFECSVFPDILHIVHVFFVFSLIRTSIKSSRKHYTDSLSKYLLLTDNFKKDS